MRGLHPEEFTSDYAASYRGIDLKSKERAGLAMCDIECGFGLDRKRWVELHFVRGPVKSSQYKRFDLSYLTKSSCRSSRFLGSWNCHLNSP
jgi:hypothetical protein